MGTWRNNHRMGASFYESVHVCPNCGAVLSPQLPVQHGDWMRCLFCRQEVMIELPELEGKMLKGKGFIVLNAAQYAVLDEHDTMEEAQEEAAAIFMNAGGYGRVVIYAPVAVIQPKLDADIRITKIGQPLVDEQKRLSAAKKEVDDATPGSDRIGS